MRFIWWKYAYFAILLLLLILLILIGWMWVIEPSDSSVTVALACAICELPLLASIPFACQTIKIDSSGVRRGFLFIQFQRLSWDDIQEVNQVTDIANGSSQIYFSMEPLNIIHFQDIHTIKNRKSIVYLSNSSKLRSYLRELADGDAGIQEKMSKLLVHL